VVGAVVAGAPLAAVGTANAASAAVWDRVAQCESGGNWGIDTGNGFSGGLQFTPSTWRANGGSGSPSSASREQQIAVAERVLASQGAGAWPVCSRRAGLTSDQAEPGRAARSGGSAVAPSAPIRSLLKAGADYTVAPGDTLSSIAAKNGIVGGWQSIFQRNKDVLNSPNVLRVGQQLIIH
jgi:LysM repeat protein